MNQQINLYEAAPETSFWQSYSPFPQIGAGLVLVLTLLYLVTLWQYQDTREQFDTLQAQQEAESQRLEQLRQSMPQPGIDPKLEAEVERLETTHRAKVALLQALTQDQIGNEAGFSAHFEGLARRQVEGLWLTKIDLGDGGARLGLEGATVRPELVPQLIQSLSQEPVFEGTQFDIFALTKTADSRAPMSFSVRAELDKVQEENN